MTMESDPIAKALLKAASSFKAGDYRQALAWYDQILRQLMFKHMLPINDSQVQHAQQKRLECFRNIRQATAD